MHGESSWNAPLTDLPMASSPTLQPEPKVGVTIWSSAHAASAMTNAARLTPRRMVLLISMVVSVGAEEKGLHRLRASLDPHGRGAVAVDAKGERVQAGARDFRRERELGAVGHRRDVGRAVGGPVQVESWADEPRAEMTGACRAV